MQLELHSLFHLEARGPGLSARVLVNSCWHTTMGWGGVGFHEPPLTTAPIAQAVGDGHIKQ